MYDLWDESPIPYDFDRWFQPTVKALVKDAIRRWQENTCVRLALAFSNYSLFVPVFKSVPKSCLNTENGKNLQTYYLYYFFWILSIFTKVNGNDIESDSVFRVLFVSFCQKMFVVKQNSLVIAGGKRAEQARIGSNSTTDPPVPVIREKPVAHRYFFPVCSLCNSCKSSSREAYAFWWGIKVIRKSERSYKF